MIGYLFILKKQTIATTHKSAKLTMSEQLKESGLEQISKDDFVFVGTIDNANDVTLWLVAKARTGLVVPPSGKRYIGLKFQKLKTTAKSYKLCEGIANGENLSQTGWKKLDAEETAACFIDTKVYATQIQALKKVLERNVSRGLGLKTETIHDSVLYNATETSTTPVLRKWYNAEVLLDEGKYRDALKRRLTELDGFAFEELMESFFQIKALGFKNVKATKKTRDGGIDIVLTCEGDAFGKITMVGQCKCVSAPISVNEVRKLKSDMEDNKDGASRGIFITTSYFSGPAKDYAKQNKSLHLIDGDGLADLFFQHAEQTPKMWEILGRHKSQLKLL